MKNGDDGVTNEKPRWTGNALKAKNRFRRRERLSRGRKEHVIQTILNGFVLTINTYGFIFVFNK